MRRILLAILLVFGLGYTVNAQLQPASLQINAGPDIYACSTGSNVLLTASSFPATPTLFAGTTSSYTVTSIPYTTLPFYNTGGTIQTFSGDDDTNRVALPFDFCFWNNLYLQGSFMYINANGFICFNNSQPTGVINASDILPAPTINLTTNFTTVPLSNTRYNNSIYGHWMDYNNTGTVRTQTIGTTPNRIFICNFDNVTMFAPTCSAAAGVTSFQIALYETTNVIEIYTKVKGQCNNTSDPTNDGRAISGILGDASDGAGVPVPGRNNTAYNISNVSPDAYRFVPNGNLPAANYTLTWTDIATNTVINAGNSPTVTALVPGLPRSYEAKIVYNNCNFTTRTVRDTINILNSNLSFNKTLVANNCLGDSNGRVLYNNYTGADSVTGLSISPQPASASIVYTASQTVADTIKGLPAGSYTVTITSANGCTKTDLVNITAPTTLSIISPFATTISMPCSTSSVCNAFTPSGGNISSGGWSLSSNIAGTSFNAPNQLCGLVAGNTYIVTVTDIKGCTATRTYSVANPPPLVIQVDSVKNFRCDTASVIQMRRQVGTGSPTAPGPGAGIYHVTFVANSLSGSFLPTYTGGFVQPVAKWVGLAPGQYTIVATDYQGCTSTTIINIDSTSRPDFGTPVTVDLLCNPIGLNPLGQFFGPAISYSSAGATITHTYTISPAVPPSTNATGIFNNLPVNNYTVTATSSVGCTKSYSFSIAQPPLLTMSFKPKNVICNGDSTGADTITINGGTPPYTVTTTTAKPQLIINANTIVVQNLTAGIYTFTVTDAQGCTVSATSTIINIYTPFIQGSYALPPLCRDSLGAIVISTTSGAGGYNYTLNPGGYNPSLGDTIPNLAPGIIYTLTTIDDAMCVNIDTISLPNPPAVTYIATANNVTCNGGNNGSISITGPNAPYTASIVYPSPSAGSFTAVPITNLSTGGNASQAYTVSVKGNGCPSTSTTIVTITQPNPIGLTPVITSVSCKNGNNGSIAVTAVTNTSFTVFYSRDNGVTYQSSNTFSGLTAGSYTIRVKDSLLGTPSCISQAFTVVVTEPDSVFVGVTFNSISCTGQLTSITATGISGTPQYQFRLDGVNPFSTPAGPSRLYPSIAAGIHTIEVRDSRGCINDTVINITQPNPIVISVFTLQPTGCGTQSNTGIDSIIITGGTPSAAGYTVSISPTAGGATILGSPNDTVIAVNLSAGTNYTITVTDANGCFTTTSFTIAPGINPTLSKLPITAVCSPSTIDLSAAIVSTATVTFHNTLAQANSNTSALAGVNTYGTVGSNQKLYVRATATNGCFIIDSVVFTIHPKPVAATIANIDVCANASISIPAFTGAPSTNVAYNWYHTNTTMGLPAASGLGNIAPYTGINAGNSTLVDSFMIVPIYIPGGCIGDTIKFTVSVKPKPTITQQANLSFCAGDNSSQITFSGNNISGVNYTWYTTAIPNIGSGAATTGSPDLAAFTTANSGSTVLTKIFKVVASVNGCISDTMQFNIEVKPVPTVSSVPNQNICNAVSTTGINFTGNLGVATTYSWAKDANNIGAVASSGVGNIASFTGVNTGTADITSVFTVTPSSNGCTGASITFSITVKPTPIINPILDTTLCAGSIYPGKTITTNGVAGTNITWAAPALPNIGAIGTSGTSTIPVFTTIGATTTLVKPITVSATANGCPAANVVFNIIINPVPTINNIPNGSYCNGVAVPTINITGNAVAGVVYTWYRDSSVANFGANSGVNSIPTFTGVNTGSTDITAVYTVTASANGCSATTTTFSITVKPTPVVDPLTSYTYCLGQVSPLITLTGTPAGTTYNWSTTAGPNIGLAATSGSNTIPSFTAANTGISTLCKTFNVVPTLNLCPGTAATFTICVRPNPTINTIANQTVCNNISTAAIIPSGNAVAGVVYTWYRDSSISIGAIGNSGTGTIPSFTATNITNTAITNTFTVTATVSGCGTNSTTFSIIVSPTPTITAVANDTVCPSQNFAATTFVNSVASGVTYSWTNNNISTGYLASGTGNLPSVIGTNNTPAYNTSTFVITATAAGCTYTANVVKVVKPFITITPTANITLCNNNTVNVPAFVTNGTNSTLNWQHFNNTVGLSSLSGTGNIPSFTATNNGSTVVRDTFVVTGTDLGCNLLADTFILLINPTPTINTLTNITTCGGTVSVPAFTSPAIFGTLTYTWANSNTSIGLGASGSGNIGSFTAVNSGNTQQCGVVSVIGTTAAGCPSAATPVITICVDPTPIIAPIANISYCHNATTLAIVPSITNSVVGTNFSWTNNNTNTGLAASGTGNIPSFTTTNTTSAPINSVITVTADYNGCSTNTTFTLTVNPLPNPTITTFNSALCLNTSSTFVANNGINPPATVSAVSWTSSNNTIATVTAGGVVTGVGVGSAVITYSVTTNDGCSASTNVNIVVNELPTLAISNIVNPGCNGVTNPGTFSVTASNGSAPYTIGANNGATSNNGTPSALISTANTASATYLVTVTDGKLCTATSNVSLVAPTSPNITLGGTLVAACNGTSTGAVGFSIVNGTNVVTTANLVLTPNVAGAVFTLDSVKNLPANTYTLRVVDANNCIDSIIFTITQPAPLNFSFTTDSVNCNGGNDGSITVLPSGGNGGYTITSVPAGTVAGFTISGLSANVYAVTVTDSKQCASIQNVTVNQPAMLNSNAQNVVLNCKFGDSSLTVFASGGVSPLEYSLNYNTFISNNTFSNLDSGIYVLVTKDFYGCTDTITAYITEPDSILSGTISNVNNPGCGVSANTGSFVVTAYGGNGGYTYNIPSGSTAANGNTANITGLSTGTYNVTIADSKGCTTIVTQGLFNSLSPVITLDSFINPTCFGSNDGKIFYSVTNGAKVVTLAQVTYTNTNTGTSVTGGSVGLNLFGLDSITNLINGTYNIVVNDSNTCQATLAVNITEPQPLNVVLVADSVSCNGLSDGSIVVNITGGNGGNSITWTPNVLGSTLAGDTIKNLPIGSYNVSVTDAKGCTKLSTVTIYQPAPLVINATSAQINCFGGDTTVFLSANGGTSPYQYSPNGIGYSSMSTLLNQAGLITHTYYVRDFNNCIDTVQYLIPSPASALTAYVSNFIAPGCGSGSYTITASGGVGPYTGTVNNGAGITTNTNPFTVTSVTSSTPYTATITDFNGCKFEVDTIFNPPVLPILNVDSFKNPLCNGQANGILYYSYIIGSSPVPANGVTLTTLSNGVVPGINITSTSISNIPAGTYILKVTDAGACFDDAIVVFTNPPVLTATAVADSANCFNQASGSITVTSTGGTPVYSYQLNTFSFQSGNTFDSLVADSYTIIVRDANMCTTNLTVMVQQPAALSLNLTTANINCFGGDTTIIPTAFGGVPSYSYSLNNSTYGPASSILANLVAGPYIVYVRDANLCTTFGNISISQPTTPLSASISAVVNPGCGANANAGSFQVTASGGTSAYTYSNISGPGAPVINALTGVASNLQNGTYLVTVTDSKGCQTVVSQTLSAAGSPSIVLNSVTAPLCNNGTDGKAFYTITAGSSPITLANVSITPSGTKFLNSATNLASGNYVVTVTDNNSCTTNLNITVPVTPQLVISTIIDSVLCGIGAQNTGAITIIASGGTPGYRYRLNNGGFFVGNTFNSLAPGPYTVCVRDTNSCLACDTVTIYAPSPIVTSIAVPNIRCFGDDTCITITASGGNPPYEYRLNLLPWQASNQFCNLPAGTYIVRTRDANLCNIVDTITISQPSSAVSVSVNSITPPGCNFVTNPGSFTAIANGGTVGTSYTYSISGAGSPLIGTTTGNATNLQTGTYIVTAFDGNFCTAQTTTTLTPANAPTISVAVTDATCNAKCDGTATVTATGGLAPYTYSWGATNINDSICAGIYPVTVTDANACSVAITYTINQPNPLSGLAITFTSNPVSSSINNGTITVGGVTGGTAPYTYFINNGAGQASATFNGLNASLHTICVTDANACDTICITQLLTAPTVLTAICTTYADSCFNSNKGKIIVNTGGSVGPYTYAAIGAAMSTPLLTGVNNSVATYSNLAPGTYSIEVTASNGDKDTTVCTVNPATPVNAIVLPLNPICVPNNSGAIAIAATGGTGAYTASALNTATNTTSNLLALPGTIPSLVAGNYLVTITDNNGCIDMGTVVLNPPTPLTITNIASIAPSCDPNNDGCISFTVNNSTSTNINYTINGGTPIYSTASFNQCTFTDICYTIIATDTATGCNTSAVICVPSPILPTISLVDTNYTGCATPSGSVTISAASGVGPYTYAFDFGTYGNPSTTNGLATGSHTAVVRDAKGCTDTLIFFIQQAGLPTLTVTNITSPLCHDDTNGVVTYTSSGVVVPSGTAFVTGYSTHTAPTISNLLAGGTLILTATDANGCVNTTSVVIPNPTPVTLVIDTNAITTNGANNGSITAVASGGTGTYTYTLTKLPGGAPTSNVNGIFPGLSGGTYQVLATDANGCTVTATGLIIEPGAILCGFDSILTPLCFGDGNGSIEITFSGGSGTGYTLLNIVPPSGVLPPTPLGNTINPNYISDMFAGQYIFVVRDGNNQIDSCYYTMVQPNPLSIDSVLVIAPGCFPNNNGCVSVKLASGGTPPLSFAVDGQSLVLVGDSICNLTAGNHYVVVYDSNFCTDTLYINIPPAIGFTAVLDSIKTPTCVGAGNNGAAYFSFPGSVGAVSATINPATVGNSLTALSCGINYTIIFTDAKGCKDTVSVNLPCPPSPYLTFNLDSVIKCNGGSTTLSFNGLGGAPTYTITMNGVTVTSPVTVNVPSGLSTTYNFVITDSKGCDSSFTYTLTQPSILGITATVNNVTVFGASTGSINPTVSGGTPTYTITVTNSSGTTVSTTGLPADTYLVCVTDANLCTSCINVTITQPGQLFCTVTDTNAVACAPTTPIQGALGTATLTVAGGTANYTWSTISGPTNPPTVTTPGTTNNYSSLQAGTYVIQVADAAGATALCTAVIAAPPALTIATSFINPLCIPAASGSITTTNTGGTGAITTTYNGLITNTGLTAGNYVVISTDANTCSVSTNVTLTAPTSPVISAGAITPDDCNAALTGAVALTTTGNNGSFTIAPSSTGLLGGTTYTFIVTDSLGCKDTVNAIVPYTPNPIVLIDSVEQPLCNGDTNGFVAYTVTPGANITLSGSAYVAGTTVIGTTIISNVKAGTLNITATNPITGCDTVITVTIAQPSAVVASATATSVSGAGLNTGSITPNFTGGTPSSFAPFYTYTVDSFGTPKPLTGLYAGTYTVTGTDLNGCTSSTIVVITEPNPLVIIGTQTVVLCKGANTGVINASATGGVPIAGTNYNWQIEDVSSGMITNVVNAASVQQSTLTADYYIITATDANGNTKTILLHITEPAAIVSIDSIKTIAPSCNPINNGCITVYPNGGTGSTYTININNTSTAQSWTIITSTTNTQCNLPPGNYVITATDINNCTSTTSVILATPAPPTITGIITTNEFCNPDSNGTIIITASGGSGLLEYGLNSSLNNSGNNTIQALWAGTFTAYVVDSAGCYDSALVNITKKQNPIINSVSITNDNCTGPNVGTATVTATGNTLSYQIDGGTPQLSNFFSALNNGTHTITVIDSFGCTKDTIINIGLLAAPSIVLTGTTLDNCDTARTGTFTFTSNAAAGSTVAYTSTIGIANSLTYNSGIISGTGVLGNYAPTAYTVTITDAVTGCTSSSVANVSRTIPLIISSTNAIPNLCNGDSTGIIKINANATIINSLGIHPLGLWLSSNDSLKNLISGTYLVIAADSNGCLDSIVSNIIPPPAITIASASTLPINCFGDSNGSYLVTAAGGTGFITYTIINTPNNTYNLGGFDSLYAGTFTVTATDQNGCTITDTKTVGNVPQLLLTAPAVTNVLCNGDSTGKICISSTGGNTGIKTYSTQFGASIPYTIGCFNNLWALTSYSITVSDTKGCTSSVAVQVTQNSPILITIDSIRSVRCFGEANGFIDISATGGVPAYQYSKNGGSFGNTDTFMNLIANPNYIITVKDAVGCTESTVINITQPALLTNVNFTYTNVLCNGAANGTITPGIVGGTPIYTSTILPTGTSNTTNTPFTGIGPGTYTVNTVDSKGCTISTSVTITEPAPLNPISFVKNITCFGFNDGSICIPNTGGTPPFQYSKDNGVTYQADSCFLNLAPGTYLLIIRDSNNCTFKDTITITQPSAPLAFSPAPIVTNVLCFGDSTGKIQINVTGGTQLSGAVYYNHTIVGPTSALTQKIAINGEVEFNNLKAGTYNITITDANGCVLNTVITITQNPQIIFTNLEWQQPRCFGENNGFIEVEGVGGVPTITYNCEPTWPAYQNNGTFQGLASQTYTINIKDAVGCSIDTIFYLPTPDPLQFSNITTTDVNCEGAQDGTISATAIGANGEYRYFVTPGVRVNRTGVFVGFNPGTYTISVVDTLGCKLDSTVQIDLNPTPISVSTLKTDITNCNGFGLDGTATAQVNGGTAPYTYLWSTSPAQSTQSVNSLAPGFYIVDVTDASGCLGSDTVEIEPGNCCQQVFIPNIFTPNNDSRNDMFKSTNALALDIELLNFNIYDRWGNRVFNTVGINEAWDGTFRGVNAEEGVYHYYYRYRCNIDGNIYLLKGDLTLVR
jgi:gliding motility-associated-like protein